MLAMVWRNRVERKTERRNPFPRIHEVHNRSSSKTKLGNYKVSGEVTMIWMEILAKVEKHGTG